MDEVYGDSEKVFDISVTNYREDEEPELTEISVTKEWDDERCSRLPSRINHCKL